MDKLQTTDQSASLERQPRLVELAKELYDLNTLVAYALSDIQLLDWARIIKRLRPETTPEILSDIVNKILSGEFEWDRHKGIQNIFLHLPKKSNIDQSEYANHFVMPDPYPFK